LVLDAVTCVDRLYARLGASEFRAGRRLAVDDTLWGGGGGGPDLQAAAAAARWLEQKKGKTRLCKAAAVGGMDRGGCR